VRELPEHAAPVPSDELDAVGLVLPGVPQLGEDGGKDLELSLVGQIQLEVDVEQVGELRG
jgi:hypothetical protein